MLYNQGSATEKMSNANATKIMSDSKTYVFGNEGAGGNLLASVIPALQNRGIDTSYLMGLMSGNNNGGFFGNNGGFQDIIALIVIAAIFGNGNFGFGGNGNNQNSQLLTSLLERNGVDIAALGTSINCSSDRIRDAIGQVSTQICNLAGQNAMSFQQVMNSIMSGNSALASQLSNCCCDLKGIMSEGFSSIGYALRDQTCNLERSGSANTQAILAKLDAIEDSRKDRELAEKDRMIATLTARSERQAELQPIYQALQEIQCNQPPVKKISCPEQYVPINTGINATYGLIPTGCGYGYGYPYGNFCNGFNNAF